MLLAALLVCAVSHSVMRSFVNVAVSVASLIGEYPFLYEDRGRRLQPVLPDYTSPPTDVALAATPEAYRDDAIIDAGRDAAANGTCFKNVSLCQIPFVPAVDSPLLGVVFYCGGLVDPRGYSPIAKQLSERYGIAVALQIFENDLAFSPTSCDSGRVKYASDLFPSVEKWLLAGHSYGGIAATADVWSAQNDTSTKVGGLALLASYVSQDVGCGQVDFSDTQLPVASINATEDLIVNATNFAKGITFLPPNDTFHLEILGGNHAQFGSYDASERSVVSDRVDGNATIPEKVQLDLTIAAIAHVASRMGIPLPEVQEGGEIMTSSGGRDLPLRRFIVTISSILVYLITF